MKEAIVYGLVLAGGKSTRMGMDKGSIVYHQIPQRQHLYQMMEKVCHRTFYSIREEQLSEFQQDSSNFILDDNKYRGPFNGILSAHSRFPKVAWMVLACDLPFMSVSALQSLLSQRDTNYLATAFTTEKGGLPEPLAAIWEPEGLATSMGYLKNGTGTCPRKFLINAKTKLVVPEEESVLLNANSREDYNMALSKLISK